MTCGWGVFVFSCKPSCKCSIGLDLVPASSCLVDLYDNDVPSTLVENNLASIYSHVKNKGCDANNIESLVLFLLPHSRAFVVEAFGFATNR